MSAVNQMVANGMHFWDYGNAFMLESSRAGADILNPDGSFKYPSYVEDIMGPMCFDYGFGHSMGLLLRELTDLKPTDVVRGPQRNGCDKSR